jgi:hypothetical protein
VDEEAIGDFDVDQFQKLRYKDNGEKPSQGKQTTNKNNNNDNASLNPWNANSSSGKSVKKPQKQQRDSEEDEYVGDGDYDPDLDTHNNKGTKKKTTAKQKKSNCMEVEESVSLNPWKTKPAVRTNEEVDEGNDDFGETAAKANHGGNPWNETGQKKSKKSVPRDDDEEEEADDSMDDFIVGGKKKKKATAAKSKPKKAVKPTSNYGGSVDSNYRWNKLNGMIISITGTLSRKRVDIIEVCFASHF